MRTKGKTFSGKQLSIPVPRNKKEKNNTLTLRLENGYATELDIIMKDTNEKTCAGAIKKLIVNFKKDQEIISYLRNENTLLKSQVNEQTEMLLNINDSFESLATFKKALKKS